MAKRSFIRRLPMFGLFAALAIAAFPGTSAANQADSSTASPRILQSVDETKLVTISGDRKSVV